MHDDNSMVEPTQIQQKKPPKWPYVVIVVLVMMLIGGGTGGYRWHKAEKKAVEQTLEQSQQRIDEINAELEYSWQNQDQDNQATQWYKSQWKKEKNLRLKYEDSLYLFKPHGRLHIYRFLSEYDYPGTNKREGSPGD